MQGMRSRFITPAMTAARVHLSSYKFAHTNALHAYKPSTIATARMPFSSFLEDVEVDTLPRNMYEVAKSSLCMSVSTGVDEDMRSLSELSDEVLREKITLITSFSSGLLRACVLRHCHQKAFPDQPVFGLRAAAVGSVDTTDTETSALSSLDASKFYNSCIYVDDAFLSGKGSSKKRTRHKVLDLVLAEGSSLFDLEES